VPCSNRAGPLAACRLASHRITTESTAKQIEERRIIGYVCIDGNRIVGYCYGSRRTGEIQVLALLPNYECREIGKTVARCSASAVHKISTPVSGMLQESRP
jgi:hypothetical protein